MYDPPHPTHCPPLLDATSDETRPLHHRNLLAIEKIVKKHDKNSPRCKVKGRVHNYVSISTFLFAHLERSELFLLAPVLTEEMPANSAGEAHHCNICLCDVP